MNVKQLKRNKKLAGRVECHKTKESCIELVKLGKHIPLGKKTPKGTKPIKKAKKVYK